LGLRFAPLVMSWGYPGRYICDSFHDNLCVYRSLELGDNSGMRRNDTHRFWDDFLKKMAVLFISFICFCCT